MAKKKPGKTPPPDAERPGEVVAPGGPARANLVAVVTAATIACVAFSSFFPAARLWGVNHLAFLPVPVRAACIALLVIAFVPALSRGLYRILIAGAERAAAARRRPRATAALAAVALASIALFWTFRSATNLLGDGQLIVRSFEAAEEGHDQVIMRSARAIVTEEVIAPGTTLLYYGAIKALKPLERPPVDSMRLLNCVLGAVFLFFVLLAWSSRAVPAESRVWLLLLALFSSSMVLYFGYIENYTAPMLLLAFYVLAAFRGLHGRSSPWLAVFPLAGAIYAHVQCVLFVPSFAYLVLWTRLRRRRGLLLRRWMPAFSAVAILGVVGATLYPPIRRFYVPLGTGSAEYALFSPDHLLDVANEILLLLPILPTVLAMAWVGRRADRAGGRNPTREPWAVKNPASWFSHPAEWQLVGTMLVPCALYLVLFHPEIGMARDWDLFSMTTTALVPLVLLVLNRYTRAAAAPPEVVARFAAPALLLVAALGTSWVALNASKPWTVDRFQRILAYDRTHASYAWENLAILQHDDGQLKEAIRTMERAVEVSRNPRQIVRLAVYLEEDGRMDEAVTMLEEVLARRPDFSRARFRLVLFLEKTERWDRMLPVARDGVKHSPGEPIYHFFYGESLMRAGQTEEGLRVLRACQSMTLPQTVKDYIASTLAAHGVQ